MRNEFLNFFSRQPLLLSPALLYSSCFAAIYDAVLAVRQAHPMNMQEMTAKRPKCVIGCEG